MAVTTYNTLVPALRFREFTDDWSLEYLSEFMTFRNGINADKQQYGQGYKFINVLDIIAEEPITHDKIIGSVDISADAFDKSMVSFGDILFQRSSETREEAGQANVYLDKDKPATFGGFVIRGKSKGNYQPVFMNFLLKTSLARKEITARSGGSTRYNIGQATLESIPIIITKTDEEQQKIADFLTSVDTKIQQLKLKHTLMQQYKKGVMHQLFSQQVRFKDDDGRNYPDWSERRLESLCESIISGKSKKTTNGEIPVYGSTGIIGCSHVATHHGKFILVARVGANAGKLNYVDGSFSVTDNTLVIDLKDKDSAYFVFTVLKSLNLNRFIFGSGQPLITGSLLKKLTLYIPVDISEQQKISALIASIDEKIQQLYIQMTQAETFKKGLLEQMFV